MRRMAEVAERPLTVLLLQIGGAPELWRELKEDVHSMNEAGMTVTGQVGCRPVGILMGWCAPFSLFAMPFISIKRSFYQDRLGTNIGKAALPFCKPEALSPQLCKLPSCCCCCCCYEYQ